MRIELAPPPGDELRELIAASKVSGNARSWTFGPASVMAKGCSRIGSRCVGLSYCGTTCWGGRTEEAFDLDPRLPLGRWRVSVPGQIVEKLVENLFLVHRDAGLRH